MDVIDVLLKELPDVYRELAKEDIEICLKNNLNHPSSTSDILYGNIVDRYYWLMKSRDHAVLDKDFWDGIWEELNFL